jgi:hypothetical protein
MIASVAGTQKHNSKTKKINATFPRNCLIEKVVHYGLSLISAAGTVEG